MNQHIEKTITDYQRGIELLAKLSNGIQIPEKFNALISELDVRLSAYAWDDDRDLTLTLAAETFGAHGWTETPDGKDYHWRKKVGGVEIVIYNANKRVEKARPVMPNEFPVLLKNSNQ